MLNGLTTDQQRALCQKLIESFLTIGALQEWLRAHYAAALPQLAMGNLPTELMNLMAWASSVDGMRTLLQKLVDDPPSLEIAPIIYGLTSGEICPRRPINPYGLPPVPAHQSWFAADRPFVDRKQLRDHLMDLDQSQGARQILIIDGERRTGKSFAICLAQRFDGARNAPRPPLNLDNFARVGARLSARELAIEIAGGDDQGCPSYDDTKEDEAVPHLVQWLTGKLKGATRWVIIDHCNRLVLTQAARSVLASLAEELWNGYLPNLRLILVDFDRNALPAGWRDQVRYDHAELPDEQRVAEWCEQLATAAKRQIPSGAPAQWAHEVFCGLGGLDQTDGSWHAGLERQLRQAVKHVMACEELP